MIKRFLFISYFFLSQIFFCLGFYGGATSTHSTKIIWYNFFYFQYVLFHKKLSQLWWFSSAGRFWMEIFGWWIQISGYQFSNSMINPINLNTIPHGIMIETIYSGVKNVTSVTAMRILTALQIPVLARLLRLWWIVRAMARCFSTIPSLEKSLFFFFFVHINGASKCD